ncbi:MAG: ATP-binding cassette domain-containing protein [Mariniphaga sp.]|nr:ATP-binding cassette domain-containing protein [Mariniphaga sp.]
MVEPIIELKDADIYQRETLVLKNINLSINKGEFLYIIGKVGSGKSSLLKTFYNELPLIVGTGTICGYQLDKIRASEVPFLRRKLGIVFQDFQLLTDRTVYKNFEFVLKATGWNNDKSIKNRINEVLTMVEMGHAGPRKPHQLSGGEQQRIVIARALLNNPQIILADEPTGNLDPETSDALLQLFMDINKEGKTIVMATHDYPIIQRFPARKIICEANTIRDLADDTEIIDFESLLEDLRTE